ncbi:MAG: ROK family protein [Actinomycetia bacterium]|nr:ROK family protein [Actinomycetes bacterium]
MAAYTVGVDVGGTKVAAVLVDDAGAIMRRSRAETESADYAGLVAGIVSAVTEVREGVEMSGVGLAIAGNVAADGSSVLFSPHLPLAGEPLAQDLCGALGTRVFIDNDANAAAWAEHECGAGRGAGEMLFVALGTGLGAGLILRDRMYRGYHGFAGEAGHITVVIDGRACPCGSRGCWERYASGTALVSHYVERGGDPEVGGPGITRAAAKGDPLALAALEDVGEWLGRGLASLVAVLDPELIVVGGGVSESGDLLLDPARRALASSVMGAGRRPLPRVVAAELGNAAGVVGAAMLARHDGQ